MDKQFIVADISNASLKRIIILPLIERAYLRQTSRQPKREEHSVNHKPNTGTPYVTEFVKTQHFAHFTKIEIDIVT